MMLRLTLLLLLTTASLPGDAEQDITDVVSTLATALSESNVPEFLKALDHDMPDYYQLEHDVSGLVSATLISCSVDLIGNTGSATAQTADLDWYMVLKSQQDENLIERRRTKVIMKIEKRGKKWIVTSFKPISLFAPMTAR